VALSVRDLVVRYGGVIAVNDASFDVPRGAIVGLIGPNGAGKTTVIDAISGFCRCSGTVELGGTRLDGMPPYRRIRHGLGRTFQGIELWNELTVVENVLVGPGASQPDDDVAALFALLRLDELRDRPASELSQGQRQLVSIARALVARPQVVLLDEPAAGLDSSESAWLADRLREIRDAGTTVLLVDHDMNLVLNLCDHVEVLDFGSIIAKGTPAEVRGSDIVAEAYLGSTHARPKVGAV
jgi:ABC-type branched-subunit amino acid transport system ATPase component